jgi:hypothetical protein
MSQNASRLAGFLHFLLKKAKIHARSAKKVKEYVND